MLTYNQIRNAMQNIAPKYKVKSASCFGSYASGRQTENSDLDILVEFVNPYVSLYDLIGLEEEIESQLHVPIDIATFPLPTGSKLLIDKTVQVYGS
ncbi:MAG: nucleotidyltransferase domain-containing protein [Clostridiales Family XIII bacterium]|jgi:predicted nucleotidyltransferase|nr:nucleotidyltransferase domain-containing protein [Clostridiales Family XIII bacterium]